MKKKLSLRLISPFVEPYARYLNANILHAIRLGVAVVVTLLFSQWTQIPHSEWSTITVFIILGLLQYQGAIYTKAKERIIGTLLGIVVGLGLMWLGQDILQSSNVAWIYYVLVGIISSIIGYYSIKRLGYIGMLTGITMSMIIASDNSVGPDGLARALNVLIGTVIAVLATLILPLKATLMWRFLLANNLEACANMYDGVESYISDPSLDNRFSESTSDAATEEAATEDEKSSQKHVQLDLGATTVTDLDTPYEKNLTTYVNKDMVAQFKEINKRLLRVRGHIAATARESGMDTQTLDMIQRTQRNIIGTIDLLLSAAPKLAYIPIDDENRILMDHYHRELTQAMRHIAAVLRSPSDEMFRPITRIQVSDYPSISMLAFEWQGYFWLTNTLQRQLQGLSDLLQQSKAEWYKGSGLRYQRQEQRRIHAYGGESDLDV
ncbi:FUSC family protein [Psychrobacter lutiphocae]|uniref:FUSC family protein n=1 Tax=Psychrobacter lutiphocae TaxID=540500 RepID=UPI000369E28E|nr:FUSC family protein [Psychrobacter lutiphocae]